MPKLDTAAQFLQSFHQLAERCSPWVVWQDFVTITAASIANAVDKRPDIWRKREDEYLSIIRKYSKDEQNLLSKMFALTVLALDENPAQDFLGDMYMKLELSNHWKGQFFTPWDISEMMARRTITKEGLEEQIQKQDYISVCDPACGAGCILLAFAYVCWNVYDINYQDSVLFVGQDVDPIVAKMCYIQMSLLGCPGYVVIGNTISEPVSKGTTLNPIYEHPENLWFTPLYYSSVWVTRAFHETRLYVNSELTKQRPLVLYTDTDLVAVKAETTPTPDKSQKPLPDRPPAVSAFCKFFKLDDSK